MILAGDIGGTKTDLGLFRLEDGRLESVARDTYESEEHSGLGPIIERFLSSHDGGEEIGTACFGVAGPVARGRVRTTNLPWEIAAESLVPSIGGGRVSLINDLVATAEGVSELGDDELETLQSGELDEEANAAMIAAGTGLGMALLPRIGGELRPQPSEGGHGDFAPRNAFEVGLGSFIAARLGERSAHVSVERVVSGPGIESIYEFLLERGAEENEEVRLRIESAEDRSEAISEAALAGASEICREALDRWLSAFGAVAGNLALIGLARAGLYIAGGIAPKVLPRLKDGPFLGSFLAKGRFRDLLSKIPVKVVLNPHAALLGAAHHAARFLR